MDPVAMAGSALKLLSVLKNNMDEAAKATERGIELNRVISMFEITISMIPSRGDGKKVKEMKSASKIMDDKVDVDACMFTYNFLILCNHIFIVFF
jgi:urease gamma subunit